MNPQATPLYARTDSGVYLVIGWMFDGGRANYLDAVGVEIGTRNAVKATPLGAARFFTTLDEAKRARP